MRGKIWLALLLGAIALGLVTAQGMMGQPGQQDREWTQSRGFAPGMPWTGMRGGMDMMGPGMMGGMGMMQVFPPTASPLPAEELVERLEAAAREFGGEATLSDVMHFSNGSYAQVVDEQGQGLAEILVDRYTGIVTPEPGPNMMWNEGGVMSWFGNRSPRSSDPRYGQEEAAELANTFLNEFLPGAQVVAGQAFPGYYTFDYGIEDVDGMLSIHGQTGQVWLHTWHGAYLGGAHEE